MANMRQSIRTLGTTTNEIFPRRKVVLPNISVFSNAPAELKASWLPAYETRLAQPDDVSLVLLPKGAEVSGRAGFAARVGPYLVAEQLTRDDPVDHLQTMGLFDAGDPVVDVTAETVLIARFGEGTWGHWLVELLPKVAVCEAMWPGRFRYAVPRWILQGGLFSDRIFESMAFYGVAADRLVQIQSDHVVRFSQLYAVTPVYSNMAPHPDVVGLMNQTKLHDPTSSTATPKVALLRNDTRRQIANVNEVKIILGQHGFGVVDIAAKTFAEQRDVFTGGSLVFSVLGSGLSGLIFSPPGARVLAAAPERFGDRFFYGILQGKQNAKWAEVRGPVVEEDPKHYRDSSFEVPILELRHALEALAS